jgi:glycosyltransferase involved in cell wall biosynthesis
LRKGDNLRCRVNVLLATYNGAKYLHEQLQSIESQTLPAFRVTIRDDGSVDGTLSQLEEWAAGRPIVRLLRGPRLGVTKNFFALLASSDEDSDFFSFADQDDVWLPDKIENAVSSLSRHSADKPLLYCSRLEYVDEELSHLGYSRIPRRISFANALVQNVATGCTMMLNRRARDMICKSLPEKALLHDWWCYLTVSAFGTAIFDERPAIKYRQHMNNRVGATVSRLELFNRRLEKFFRQESTGRQLVDQAAEFKRCFGDLIGAREKETLERFLSVRGGLWRRASYTATMDVRRQSWIDTAILRTMILIGRV